MNPSRSFSHGVGSIHVSVWIVVPLMEVVAIKRRCNLQMIMLQ